MRQILLDNSQCIWPHVSILCNIRTNILYLSLILSLILESVAYLVELSGKVWPLSSQEVCLCLLKVFLFKCVPSLQVSWQKFRIECTEWSQVPLTCPTRTSATLSGQWSSATLWAESQSCWWTYISTPSFGLPALINSSSASANLPWCVCQCEKMKCNCVTLCAVHAQHTPHPPSIVPTWGGCLPAWTWGQHGQCWRQSQMN